MKQGLLPWKNLIITYDDEDGILGHGRRGKRDQKQGDEMIETKRMWLREATADDIDQIIALEEHKDNRDYPLIGTRQEHQDEIDDPNDILLIFQKKQDRSTVGYALDPPQSQIRDI